jgi:hypothetical protein
VILKNKPLLSKALEAANITTHSPITIKAINILTLGFFTIITNKRHTTLKIRNDYNEQKRIFLSIYTYSAQWD